MEAELNLSDFKSTVEKLDLSSKNSSSLSGNLSVFSKLLSLDISHNLFKTLPLGLAALQKLTFLKSCFNSLSSIDEVTSLHQLRSLVLNNNLLTKTPDFSSLAELCGLGFLELIGGLFVLPFGFSAFAQFLDGISSRLWMHIFEQVEPLSQQN